MKKIIAFFITAFLISTVVTAGVTPHAAFTSPSNIVITFTIPEGHKVYAESITVSAAVKAADDEVMLTAVQPPEPVEQNVLGEIEKVYPSDVAFAYQLSDAFTNTHIVTVGWQACTETTCFMPETKQFKAFESIEAEPETVETDTSTPDRTLAAYADASKFLTFLTPENDAAKGKKQNPLERARERGGIFLLIAAIILGGVLLNLTPCVLPLIPVNLAILGIGTHAASRRQGLLVGSFFGLGITIAFGALGIISVLTGASFGTLQSSPVFNAAIAIIFCVLALAMLDVITIDFSRFSAHKQQKNNDSKKPASLGMRLAGAFAAGAGSALLAGACVAPVLIWTLVMSASLVSTGQSAGAFLPLFLGLGMGLPWVFFGGGIGALPRPGKWMNTIKIGFAIVFLIFAGFYARTAWRILSPAKQSEETQTDIAWLASEAELNEALATAPKPALIYLTADWCGACKKMGATTFKNPDVQKALKSYHAVKIDCTVFDDPDVKAIVKRLGAPGLPFFAIFETTAD